MRRGALVKIQQLCWKSANRQGGQNLYLTAEGELKQIEIPDNKQNKIKYNAEYRINYPAGANTCSNIFGAR